MPLQLLVHRLFVLEDAKFFAGPAEPDVRHILPADHLRQLLHANHATLRNPAHPLRGPRKPFQDLFLEGVCPVNGHCRGPMEHVVRATHLLVVVLSDRTATKRGTGRARTRKRSINVPLHLRIPHVRIDVREYDHGIGRHGRGWWQHHELVALLVTDLLRVGLLCDTLYILC